MTESAERLKPTLAELSAQDRAALAHYLIQSLEDESDADVEAAWDAELARRLEEIKSGRARGESADKVFARLREKYS